MAIEERTPINSLYLSPNSLNFSRQHRKTISISALMGGAIGGLLFMVIGMLVSINTFTLPTLPAASVFYDQLSLVFAVFVAGMIFGAASGALVGIGVPPYEDKNPEN